MIDVDALQEEIAELKSENEDLRAELKAMVYTVKRNWEKLIGLEKFNPISRGKDQYDCAIEIIKREGW
jgi:hypothetical protein